MKRTRRGKIKPGLGEIESGGEKKDGSILDSQTGTELALAQKGGTGATQRSSFARLARTETTTKMMEANPAAKAQQNGPRKKARERGGGAAKNLLPNEEIRVRWLGTGVGLRTSEGKTRKGVSRYEPPNRTGDTWKL